MEWLEAALENPQENWGIWGLMALFMARLAWSSMGVMLSMSKNANQDNDIKLRMMDEQTAARKSFERRDDENAKRLERMMDIQESSINRIDVTTQATLQNTRVIEQSGQSIERRLTSIERNIKRMVEGKKVTQ